MKEIFLNKAYDWDEPVEVSPYNPKWPHFFEEEKAVIKRFMTDNLVEIEHFGSSSVPGLDAKPIIDMLIGLKKLQLSDFEMKGFLSIGYSYHGEANVPGRIHMKKRGYRNFNLAIVKYDSDIWKNNIAIRDYLREYPEVRDQYAEHKLKVYGSGMDMLAKYSQNKGQFVLDILDKARKWKGD